MRTGQPKHLRGAPIPPSSGLSPVPFSALALMLPLCVALRLGAASPEDPPGEVLGREGQVEHTGPRTNWLPAFVGQKLFVQDRLRTRALSRATVQLAELGRLRVNELTTLEILPPRATTGRATIDLRAGALYFFTRDRPREFILQMPYAIGASRGTEWLAVVEPGGRTVLTVMDGEVEISNPLGTVVLRRGDQGVVEAGQPPVKTAVIQAENLVQWWLYYPAVLDPDELELAPIDRAALAGSLEAYRSGDVLRALEMYPGARQPAGDSERVYHAGLLLAAGRVDQATAELAAVDAAAPRARALRQLIATVTRHDATSEPRLAPASDRLASEWLAESYFRQSQFELRSALEAAKRAAARSTNFAFAWTRVAELEFSFGRIGEATHALDRALAQAPHHAQALALRGFLFAARQAFEEAAASFEEAIRIDGALGNAWLGRGLCRIHEGDVEGGRRDLQTAAALEPNRSLLRSYLGKAFAATGDARHARQELDLARQLDPMDPTPWLYAAFLDHDDHRFNEAVGDLERSLDLNDNRRVYRSRLLLDQDRATRGAGLATIYKAAGMDEVSVREAARAVTADYANYSAHLFLANSFDALRDPTRFNLRYETVWFNELLLANLLAPVGAGVFSQAISQQEYSRLFEADRLGLVSTTDLRSDGQYREIVSQFGSFGTGSYSFDLDWQRNEGVRPNNGLDRIEWYTQLKQQISEQNSLFVLTKYQDYHAGDNFQYYDPHNPTNTRPSFTFDEVQAPTLLAAWHREWAPGVHTLAMAGRLSNDQRITDRAVPVLVLTTNLSSAGQWLTFYQPHDIRYESEFQILTAELGQILQAGRHGAVFGARYQSGDFTTANALTSTSFPGFFPGVDQTVRDRFEHVEGYAYDTWEIVDDLHLTGGLAYDRLTFPENHRQVPVQEGSTTRDRLGPKAAFVWSPRREITLRGAYTRSLGGVSFDESYRLEPTQLAGFNQAFRTVIPESVAGSVSAPAFETIGSALDLKFPTQTYLGLQALRTDSEVARKFGVLIYDNFQAAYPSSVSQNLNFHESEFGAALHQWLSAEWSMGASYRFTRSELTTRFPSLSSALNPGFNRTEQADLHRAGFHVLFNHPAGFFTGVEAEWYAQANSGYTTPRPGDDFVQIHLHAGWRFPRQRGEIRLGLLNVTAQDYRLNPLNAYAELPRQRVLAAQLKFRF